MKAAVFYGPKDIRVEWVEEPTLGPGDILVKVKACGICGSDIHLYKSGPNTLNPQAHIMGHEFSGEVVEVGSRVEGIRAGQRVVIGGFEACGECRWCRSGVSYRCSNKALVGYEADGAFAEYVRVPNAEIGITVFPLSDALSWDVGATVEPVSVGLFSVKRADPRPEDTVVVLGMGMIGLSAVQALQAREVSNVIVSEISTKRRQAAQAFGITAAIDPKSADPAVAVEEITSGEMADIVIECTGNPSVFRQALDMVRGGGKVMQVGVFQQPMELDMNLLLRRNITLRGCLGGSFTTALELLESGKIRTEHLITHRFPLEEAPAAFEAQLDTEESVKVIIKP